MDKPTNALNLEEIKGLMAKVKLPWEARNSFWVYEGRDIVVRAGLDDFDAKARTALIVAAVNALPTLIEQYERMRDAIADAPEPYEYMKKADFNALPVTMRGFIDAHRSWMQRARSALNQQEETNGLANG